MPLQSRKKREKGTFPMEHDQDEVAEGHSLFVVGQASSEDEGAEDDEEAFFVHGTGLAQHSLRLESIEIGLPDIYCTKIGLGIGWGKDHVAELQRRGMPYHFMNERESFRCGGRHQDLFVPSGPHPYQGSRNKLYDEVKTCQGAACNRPGTLPIDSKEYQGFIKLLKRRESGRVGSLLRVVARRMKNKDCDKITLRWSEKKLKYAKDHLVGALEVEAPDQDIRHKRSKLQTKSRRE